jgi:hypothetical protein
MSTPTQRAGMCLSYLMIGIARAVDNRKKRLRKYENR